MAVTRGTKKSNEETTEKKVAPKTTAKKAPAKKAAPKKPVVDKDTEVLVYNATTASVMYSARKGNGYIELDAFMDADYMTVEELMILKNTDRNVFKKGWLYIEDEDVIKYLGLEKEMENILLEDKIDILFESQPHEVLEIIPNLTQSTKDTVHSVLRDRYENGLINDIHLIKAFEKALNVDSVHSLLHTN
ncbi:hypothetical protein [Mammaliicoccus sciuri]|uniref:hypothetical protein n=1 Tax=Mammaliicoccus sciuri TaxID=1296 RepID=UPI0021D34A7B|nr:hypothetical protein [Mammaliicoccus sciuri]UXU70102.1 hypothetical protein MUA36_05330 [Mammaliicoccus sciuri]